MRSALHRALAFAVATFIALLLADLAVWGGYQGMHPREELGSQLLIHGAMHASVLVLSIVGAGTAFLLLRRRLPSLRAALWCGIGFAALSFFVLVASFNEAGFVGAGAWLLLGSATIAVFGALIAGRHEG